MEPRRDAHSNGGRRAFVAASLLLVLVACADDPATGGPTPPPTASSPSSAPTSREPDATSTPGRRHAAPGAEVVRVTDGDTLDVRIAGRAETVRLIGVNAPESGECFADEARQALAELVAGEEVRLEQDRSERDRFDRLLAYVSVGDTHVNAELVRRGFAIAREYPPDTARADELEAAQRQAERTGAGMWGPDGCASDVDASDIRLHVHPDAPGDDNHDLNGEWVEIRNTGETALDLAGWTVKDESATHRHTFGAGTSVPAGGTLRLYTGCGEATTTERYWCNQGSAVWNNGGDTAFLLDRDGRTVATYGY